MRLIILAATVSIFFVSCSINQKKDESDFSLTEAEVKDFIREASSRPSPKEKATYTHTLLFEDSIFWRVFENAGNRYKPMW